MSKMWTKRFRETVSESVPGGGALPACRPQPVHGLLQSRGGRLVRGRGCRRSRHGVIVEQHAQRWRLQIVELAAAGGPEERGQRRAGEQQGDGHGNEEHAHGAAFPARAAGARNMCRRYEWATTVSELSGMITAAQSGLILPARARPAASRL